MKNKQLPINIEIMIHRFLFGLIGLILSSIFLSCESEMKHDLVMENSNPKLAVNCTFNCDSSWQVYVSKTSGIQENDSWEYIENAVVSITDTIGNSIELFYSGNGQYTSPEKPQINQRYIIEVAASGFEPVEASEYQPEKIHIDYVSYKDSVAIEDSAYLSEATVIFTDNGAAKNFYQVIIYQGNSNNQLVPLWMDTDDLSVENTVNSGIVTMSTLQEYMVINDRLFDGKSHTFYFKFSKVLPNEDIYVELRLLSESLHEYVLTYSKAIGNIDNPFVEVVTVFSNIKNGVGIFGGFTSDVRKVEK
jgi:hypothetical protein